ncbi:uncharacterized protein VP01_3462g2 [Puccinia sorghi]|uniref:Uncharacterized protein n=1 Tax=Puccinia sorghi TaxID=27349 RepID=A0A0L6UW70_9BASI|nr:uncharacterized protein VP01_3462g2 [Puccinia sorghi]
MNLEQDTQLIHQENLKCLRTISRNFCIVDRLHGSIKYHSRKHVLLCKGPEKIEVLTWPGAQAAVELI